ncbi:unnamed protein product [Penicillium camemberti]|uniref:Str. FM013 n=1 Tax=Penicillium camemberti (strain FM 013) TaxID=1429867 RepID=A0A0G4PW15_PENC3|nr:unnamed protein product [Penicillium camemberti]
MSMEYHQAEVSDSHRSLTYAHGPTPTNQFSRAISHELPQTDSHKTSSSYDTDLRRTCHGEKIPDWKVPLIWPRALMIRSLHQRWRFFVV